MLCEATEMPLVENVACPLLRVAEPIVTAPSLKSTLPVGVPDPETGVTVAVKMTDEPKHEGLGDEDTEVVVSMVLEIVYNWPVKLALPAPVPPIAAPSLSA